MKVAINIIKFILISILTISILGIAIITIISSTILDKAYITKKMEENNFYEETYELVKSNFEKYIYQSGLEEDVLEDICTKEKVKNDINIIISNIYDEKQQTIDTTEIASNLNANIDKLKIKNSKNEKAIEQFVAHICEEYENTILYTKKEAKINDIYAKINNILDKMFKALIAVIIIDIILMLIINAKKISKNMQDIGISLLSLGLFDLICCKVINTKVNIQGIKVFNDTFSKTLISIIQEVIEKIKTFGIMALVIAIVIIIFTRYQESKSNKN